MRLVWSGTRNLDCIGLIYQHGFTFINWEVARAHCNLMGSDTVHPGSDNSSIFGIHPKDGGTAFLPTTVLIRQTYHNAADQDSLTSYVSSKFFNNSVPLHTVSTGSSWPRGLRAWVCGRSFVGIVSSNPNRGVYVCLLWVLCVVR